MAAGLVRRRLAFAETLWRPASAQAISHRRIRTRPLDWGKEDEDASLFPDFGKHARSTRDSWQDDPSPATSSQEAESLHQAKKFSQAEDICDFLLALSVRRHVTGYALMRFRDLLPLQFGLIDVKKTDTDEVQSKALEIAAVLRDLRQAAPVKLRRADPEDKVTDDFDDGLPNSKTRQWKWVVAVDDSTVDRSPPTNARENQVQRTLAMLQGLVIADCKRLFKVAPQIVHPRRSRLLLGIRGLGPPARREALDIATSQVPEFPVVRHRSGVLSDDSLLMSDAWASARFAQRTVLIAQKRADQQLMTKLRKEALVSKQLKKITQVISELHPRKESKELSDVLETRIDKMVEEKLNRLIDEEMKLPSSVRQETSER
mmetsp:Transcript_11552/g.20460  ORF Transcript_11552/g.20460 Transcript_11552/m.20460 type:complete len:374 (-) Transcript_11552:26-1147(-)